MGRSGALENEEARPEAYVLIILSWAMFSSVSSAEADAAPKQRREKKEAFKIDFLAPMDKDVKEIARELFAPPAKPGTILLPAAGAGVARGTKRKRGKGKDKDDKEKRDNQTLPDDMHFSSRQLVSLFLKPKFSVSCVIGLP